MIEQNYDTQSASLQESAYQRAPDSVALRKIKNVFNVVFLFSHSLQVFLEIHLVAAGGPAAPSSSVVAQRGTAAPVVVVLVVLVALTVGIAVVLQ